jgi:hypothetical protein
VVRSSLAATLAGVSAKGNCRSFMLFSSSVDVQVTLLTLVRRKAMDITHGLTHQKHGLINYTHNLTNCSQVVSGVDDDSHAVTHLIISHVSIPFSFTLIRS